MKNSFCCLLIFIISCSVFAQREFTSSSPVALKAYGNAARLYDSKQNSKALEAIDESIKADPKFIEAHMMRGDICSDLKQHDKAITSYKNAIAINPDFFPNNFLTLGREEYLLGNYDDAKNHLQKFIAYPNIKGKILWSAKKMIENADFASQAVKNPVPFEPVNMGENINSADEEYFPTITADGKTFLYTRRMKMVNPIGQHTMQEDFYKSKLIGKLWEKSTPVTEINTIGNEGAPALSADGQYLFFTSCEEKYEIPGVRKTKGSCDIFLSKKVGDLFTEPRNLNEPVNSGSWETSPSFSSDGHTLYFVRTIKGPGNIGQADIMVSHIGNNFEWSEPVSVSDSINTPDDELSVFIHPDDQTLYFSSNGHPGMGGMDIFMSRKDSAGKWTKPVNLGYPINTVNDENSFLVSPDGETAYFASDRDGGFGGDDLYEFPLYAKVRPQPVTYMKGKVYDIKTKKILFASFELIDLASGKIVVSSTSNATTGDYIVALPTGKSYALNVSKDGYLFYSENFQLKNVKSAKDPYLKDVPMKPIKTGESIVLNNIFYATDKYDLMDESRIELGKLVSFLNKNPKIKFEISGHTDSVGTNQYNQVLSEKRAKSVYDYLKTMGITSDRMVSKGYGDTKPVADNNTESGRAKNRRTEFMVTGME